MPQFDRAQLRALISLAHGHPLTDYEREKVRAALPLLEAMLAALDAKELAQLGQARGGKRKKALR